MKTITKTFLLLSLAFAHQAQALDVLAVSHFSCLTNTGIKIEGKYSGNRSRTHDLDISTQWLGVSKNFAGHFLFYVEPKGSLGITLDASHENKLYFLKMNVNPEIAGEQLVSATLTQPGFLPARPIFLAMATCRVVLGKVVY